MQEAIIHQSVKLKKLNHRGMDCIGLFFDYDASVISWIKKINGIRYSGSKRCWYLPYTSKRFADFKALCIPYTIAKRRTQETAQILDNAPITTRLKTDVVMPPLVQEKDGGNPKANIVLNKKRPLEIVLQGRHFIIKIAY